MEARILAAFGSRRAVVLLWRAVVNLNRQARPWGRTDCVHGVEELLFKYQLLMAPR